MQLRHSSIAVIQLPGFILEFEHWYLSFTIGDFLISFHNSSIIETHFIIYIVPSLPRYSFETDVNGFTKLPQF